MSGWDPDIQLARIHGNLVAMRDAPPHRYSDCFLAPHQCQEIILLLEHLAYRAKNAEEQLSERTQGANRPPLWREACRPPVTKTDEFNRTERVWIVEDKKQ